MPPWPLILRLPLLGLVFEGLWLPTWWLAGRIDTRTREPVIQEALRLEEGDLLELITTFLPAPGIDRLKAKGFDVWPVESAPSVIRTYICRTREAEGGRA